MKFSHKNYQLLKVKNYLKENTMLFFLSGFNQNSNGFLISEQYLKLSHFSFYKVFNRTSKKITMESIYLNIGLLIRAISFVIRSMIGKIQKKNLTHSFKVTSFTMLAAKLNRKIYQTKQVQTTHNLTYRSVILIALKLKSVNLLKSK